MSLSAILDQPSVPPSCEVASPAQKPEASPATVGTTVAQRPFQEKSLSKVPDFSSSVVACGDVFTHGIGRNNQLGHGQSQCETSEPTLVRGLVGTRIVHVACGAFHTACTSAAGRVFTWGRNIDGALGRSPTLLDCDPLAVPFPGIVDVHMVSCGDCHTAALDRDGKVWVWGTYKDPSGPIGIMGNDHRALDYNHKPAVVQGLTELVVEVVSGSNHTVIRTKKGTVFAWGSNAYGQLGLADAPCCQFQEFVAPREELPRANLEYREEGDNTWTFVRLPSDSRARRVLRVRHGNGAEVDASGLTLAGIQGMLAADGTTVILEMLGRDVPLAEKRALLTPKSVPGPGAAAVFASCNGTFVTTGVDAFGCGSNSDGQVGLGYASLAVTTLHKLPGLRCASWLGGGECFACALLADGQVISWGKAELCGLGADPCTPPVLQHTLVQGLPIIRSLRCGHHHTLACSSKGDILTWGAGRSSQLGKEPDQFGSGLSSNDEICNELKPYLVSSKTLESRFILLADGGAHHTAELVWDSAHLCATRPEPATASLMTEAASPAPNSPALAPSPDTKDASVLKRPASADDRGRAAPLLPLKRPATEQRLR